MIALFLGGTVEAIWKTDTNCQYAWKGDVAHEWRKNVMRMSIGEAILIEHLRFHENWSWLMPVVEKIGEYKWPDYYHHRAKDPEQDGDFDDNVYPRTFGMRDKEGLYMVRFNASALFSAKTLIEATWLAVVDFVEWYNTNIKQLK